MLSVTPIPAFTDNYIWLITHPKSSFAILVDPGDAAPALTVLKNKKLKLAAIFATHHHADHIGGIPRLLEHYPVPVFGPSREATTIVTHPCHDAEHIKIPELEASFNIIDIPGHTLGHIAFYGHGLLFCGDTLFSGGCGRIFEGTAEQMHNSLHKLSSLPMDTLVFCGHEYTLANLKFAEQIEPSNIDLKTYMIKTKQLRSQGIPTLPSSIQKENQINPFLRVDVAEVAAAACRHEGRELQQAHEIFQAIRHWKDHY